MKLLIADDQPSVHRMLEHCLNTQALGITCLLHAENGHQALELVESRQPELMLLDIEMPGLDGLTVSERLREQRDTRVIILTAYPNFKYAQRAIKNNVQDYLLKPIDVDEIHRVLAENIRQIRQQVRQRLYAAIHALLQLEVLSASRQHELAGLQERAGIRWFALAGARKGEDLRALDGVELGFTASFTWGHIGFFMFDEPRCWEAYHSGLATMAKGHVGLSQPFEDLCRLPECYNQATKAMQQGFYAPHVAAHDPGFFNRHMSPEIELPLETLHKAVESGERAWMQTAVRGLFEAFRQAGSHPVLVARLCQSLLLEHYGQLAEETGPIEDGAIHHEVQKVEESFLNALLACAQSRQQPHVKSDAQIIEDIHQYIDEHYDCDLSLDSVAARFFINKYQISRSFKKKYGMKYQDYIIQVRMERAATLAENTSRKLYEIAQAVGYNDPGYFSIAFKKYHGISPNQYRGQEKV